MNANLSIVSAAGDELFWLQAGEAAPRPLRDPAVAQQLRQRLGERSHGVVFAAPGDAVRLQALTVTRAEKRHLAASLPYTLEESLCDDIESLHFAHRELSGDTVGVAVASRDCMLAWQQRLADWSGLSEWFPEPLLLPWREGQWTVVVEADRAVLRYGSCAGASVEAALLSPLLEALAAASPPSEVVIYGRDEAADRACLPAELAGAAQWRRGGFGAALLLADPTEPRPALLQGDFAPRLPYARWWQQWRAVAALLAVAVLLHLASAGLDLRRLQGENLALRGEIQSLYRTVNPRGAVVDAEKQLQRQLDELGGGGQRSGFVPLLAALGELLDDQEGASLASVNYSAGSGELRVNLLVPDFAAVETIRSGLTASGLSATLENSARSGDRVRARLRIGGAS